MRLPVAAPGG